MLTLQLSILALSQHDFHNFPRLNPGKQRSQQCVIILPHFLPFDTFILVYIWNCVQCFSAVTMHGAATVESWWCLCRVRRLLPCPIVTDMPLNQQFRPMAAGSKNPMGWHGAYISCKLSPMVRAGQGMTKSWSRSSVSSHWVHS